MKFFQRFSKPDLDFGLTPGQKSLLISVFIVYVLVVGIVYIGNSVADQQRGKSTAYLKAQESVSRKLVSPSSAQFPPDTDNGVEVEYLGEDRYRVIGYLHSKNTFGNKQRSDFRCIVRYSGSGEWTVEEIILD